MASEQEDRLDAGDTGRTGPAGAGRPHIGILFECCGVYARVYRPPGQPFYSGRCPKCMRSVRVRVGKEGTDARLFRAR